MRWALPVALLTLACGSDAPGRGDAGLDAGATDGLAPDAADGANAGAIPCAVEAVLNAHCRACHTRPVRFGAPMPLVDLDDVHAPAVSQPARPRWQLMAEAVQGKRMPPTSAPGGPLSDDARRILLDWLTAGAPAQSARVAVCPEVPPPPPVETSLPCTPDHVFLAHAADGTSAFEVPLESDHYACFAFQVPFAAGEQAVAWGPVIDNAQHIHHWILYDSKSTTRPFGCGRDRTFLMGWAPGASTWVMPPDIGLELPEPGHWLILEAHYNNVARVAGARDRSGVAVCTTKTPRAQQAGVITFGTARFALPPDPQVDFPVTAECSARSTATLRQPLHVLGAWPHMHKLGVRLRTDIIGADGARTLVDVPRWDFNGQLGYPRDPAAFIIKPGDRVLTTCTYRNDTGTTVRFGERTEDEMCFNFTIVYPIEAASALDRVPLRLCNM